MKLEPLSLKIVKGFTKMQCVMFNLLACADLDLSSPDAMEKLKPLFPVLDRGWMIPVHAPCQHSLSWLCLWLWLWFVIVMDQVRLNLDSAQQNWMNMVLSHRGSERQAPNVLQQSLRFSAVMELRAAQNVHSKDLNTEARLRKVIEEFEESPGFQSRWALDESRIQSILNVVIGTSGPCRELMREHLHRHKWNQSAFSSDLLRRPRWLLSATLKGCNDAWKPVLTVDAEKQESFMKLVLHQFSEKIRKVRPNQRARMRLSTTDWDSWCNYACVFGAVKKEADLLSTKKADCVENLNKAFMALHLGVWCCLVLILILFLFDSDFHIAFVWFWFWFCPGITLMKSKLRSTSPPASGRFRTFASGTTWWLRRRLQWAVTGELMIVQWRSMKQRLKQLSLQWWKAKLRNLSSASCTPRLSLSSSIVWFYRIK